MGCRKLQTSGEYNADKIAPSMVTRIGSFIGGGYGSTFTSNWSGGLGVNDSANN